MSQTSLSWSERLLGLLFRVLPHHLISRLVFWATRQRGPFVTPSIRAFIRAFNVDMSDAQVQDPAQFPTFNEFFVRSLRADARPFSDNASRVISPVDGTVSQSGDIQNDRLLQAKGQTYTVEDLLGGDAAMAQRFSGGRFATIYLAPYNYHRIHMPMDGRLEKMIHVPGRLFSVAPWTVRAIPRLFARNERVVCLFDTASGPMAMVLVGAINVAAIETVWAGLVTPPKGWGVTIRDYLHEDKTLSRGMEMGRFNMGSTVILLTTDRVQWAQNLDPGETVKMGETIGSLEAETADPNE